MSKKNVQVEEEIEQTIIETPIDEVMSQGFGRYSKYVLQERAVPDVRDGLKPVQRRIIYTMTLEGNVSSKPTRKCARTVGTVIGRFHPHGDASVYEAMVRLSQDWKMRYPLISFQGNNGSIDGDGPAAYRYTEARLSELSDLLVQDLNKDVVDMELNFDDQEFEPTVLPSRFPNLLVNGSSGIAVGASTDIPPHNLNEVIDAINYRIGHKNAKVEDLLQFIKGPDFPTGGIIKDGNSLKELYEKGSGSFKLYSKTRIEEGKNVNQIIIDEIPYGKDKSEFVNNIDRVRFANKLDAILEVRDETGMDGLKIVIDIKKDSNPENILNFLFSKNALSNTIKYNMLVIDHYHPKVCSLLEVIDCYIEHQIEVITRRSNYDLKKAKARLHIVDGLIRAVSIMDQVVTLIRSSKDKANAKERLVSELNFTEVQAEAILMLQLYRLTNLDVTTLVNEKKSLEEQIEDLEALLSSPTKMNNLIKSDLNKIKDKYGDERRTTIEENGETSFNVDKRALISKDEVMIAFTKDGYFKRSQLKSFNSSNSDLPGIKQGDCFRGITKAYTTDFLVVFTNFGNFLNIPVYYLADNKWKEEGQHINQIGQLNPNEKIVCGILVHEFREDVNIAFVTKLGQIKRSSLKELEVNKYARPIKCFRLLDGDELVDVKPLNGNTNLLLVSSNGYSSFFNENDVSLVGIKAGGVKAMSSSKEKVNIVSMLTFNPDERSKIVLLTNCKGLRIVDSTHLVKTSRLGPKQQLFKSFKAYPQEAIFVEKSLKNNEITKLYALLENNNLSIISLDDVKPQPIESFLKTNLEIDSPFNFIDSYHFDVNRIDEDFKTVVVEKPIEVVKKDKKEDFEKISLFDFIDDDD
ncbi:MAG: DNA topoisomerase IV subunit A [Bacilli bacterium]|nr:DNA topoisomerase IV subunit A [Bacillales bacterium]MDY2574522.1 DNA topoisomerase IV subunit A [Bacilli bacterium]